MTRPVLVTVATAAAWLLVGCSHAGPVQVAPHSSTTVAAHDRAAAHLALCPTAAGSRWSDHSPLRAITLGCLGNGVPVSLEATLVGKPALLNLWAYWCQPCAKELPYMAEYQAKAGTTITVLTVHSDPDEGAALARLADLGVRLPGVEDGGTRVRSAVGAPAVLPVSVVVRPDGTVAKLVVRPFTSVDDISTTVAASLGVTP